MVKQTTGSSQTRVGDGEPQSAISKGLRYTVNPGAPLLYLLLATITSSGLKPTHLAVTVCAIAVIAIVRRICKSAVGARIHKELERWLLYWYDRVTYRNLTPNQLITWLTKRRFDISVGCESDKSRRYRLFGPSKEPCRRERCHFGPFRRGNRVPHFFKKNVPYRARREKPVFVGPARLGSESYSEQGHLLGWTSTGVTFEIQAKGWQTIRKLKPIRCVLHIRLRPLLFWLLEYCITVYPMEATSEKAMMHRRGPRNGVRVFGAFESSYERPKNLSKLCVCAAWEMQGERPPDCTYASHAPVHLLY
jgi:hypothetical protein